MSACQIFSSSSNQARLRKASEALASLPNESPVLMLAASRGAADDFARALCDRRGSLFGCHRTTLTGLAMTLATKPLGQRNLAPLGRLGIEALVARSVFVCRREGELNYFAPVADTPGFARSLTSTLTELWMEGVKSEQLAASGLPGRDLADLLNRYEKELHERSLADLAVIFQAKNKTPALRLRQGSLWARVITYLRSRYCCWMFLWIEGCVAKTLQEGALLCLTDHG